MIEKKCKQCNEEFITYNDIQVFCSDECKQEALAQLDKGSDECLSCQ